MMPDKDSAVCILQLNVTTNLYKHCKINLIILISKTQVKLHAVESKKHFWCQFILKWKAFSLMRPYLHLLCPQITPQKKQME